MYHIVFNVNNDYVKYAAVLMTNIIERTGPLQTKGYVFHILTDAISDVIQHKLMELEKALYKKYPCQIQVHIVGNELFNGLPQWHGNNYATYYRLCMDSFLPPDVNTCLYLDVDILVAFDVRELFSINLNDKLVAVVDATYRDISRPYKSKASDEYFFFKDIHHFNSGMMLINIELYRTLEIQKKSLDFCRIYQPPITPDEEALNAVITDELKIKLPIEYNLYIGIGAMRDSLDIDFAYKDEIRKNGFKTTFAKSEYDAAFNYPKFIHFAFNIPKPWELCLWHLDKNFKPLQYKFYDEWWKVALESPFFHEDLAFVKQTHKDRGFECYIDSISKKLCAMQSEISELSKTIEILSAGKNTYE